MIDLGGGAVPLDEAYTAYQAAWNDLLSQENMAQVITTARPTTLSWKVANKAEIFSNLMAVSAKTKQVHIGTINERFIATVVLTKPAVDDLYLLKLLERRPGSTDPLGLDSIDYIVTDMDDAFQQLLALHLNVTHEHNDNHAWISLRFGPDNAYEAKYTDHLVLQVAIRELQESIEELA